MKKKIAIILPYKEIYSHNYAGAASIWVKDYNNLSDLSQNTVIYGNLDSKLKAISKNFKNINLKKSIFSKNKTYIETFYKDCVKQNFDIIDGTSINGAIPVVNLPNMDDVVDNGIFSVGTYAEWDWCADVGTCILRLLGHSQRQLKSKPVFGPNG